MNWLYHHHHWISFRVQTLFLTFSNTQVLFFWVLFWLLRLQRYHLYFVWTNGSLTFVLLCEFGWLSNTGLLLIYMGFGYLLQICMPFAMSVFYCGYYMFLWGCFSNLWIFVMFVGLFFILLSWDCWRKLSVGLFSYEWFASCSALMENCVNWTL